MLTSIGGEDQVKVLRHVDPAVLAADPKPFFGLSDNTNLHHLLWNAGIVSYYGGAVMTDAGRCGSRNPHTAEAFEAAFLGSGWYDLRPAEKFTDVDQRWELAESLEREPEMLPGAGWTWHVPGGDTPVEGRLWGGCLEIVDFQLRVGRWVRPVEEYAGCVLFLETSEEMPTAQYVGEVLMCAGERGLLEQFAAVLVGRPKAWNFDQQNDAAGRAAYVAAQREAVLAPWRSTRRPCRWCSTSTAGTPTRSSCCPHGGWVRVDPAAGTVASATESCVPSGEDQRHDEHGHPGSRVEHAGRDVGEVVRALVEPRQHLDHREGEEHGHPPAQGRCEEPDDDGRAGVGRGGGGDVPGGEAVVGHQPGSRILTGGRWGDQHRGHGVEGADADDEEGEERRGAPAALPDRERDGDDGRDAGADGGLTEQRAGVGERGQGGGALVGEPPRHVVVPRVDPRAERTGDQPAEREDRAEDDGPGDQHHRRGAEPAAARAVLLRLVGVASVRPGDVAGPGIMT